MKNLQTYVGIGLILSGLAIAACGFKKETKVVQSYADRCLQLCLNAGGNASYLYPNSRQCSCYFRGYGWANPIELDRNE